MERFPKALSSEIVIMGALAAGAVVTAIATFKVLQANPDQFGLDLPSYIEGARRLAATGSPYSAELHAGPLENVNTNIAIAYLYPPPLAQLFGPIAGLGLTLMAWIWTLSQAAFLLILLPIVYQRFGGTWDRRHLVALLLAIVAFSPNLIAVYIGNVSGWITILIAIMLIAGARTRAASAAAAMWLKLTPGVFAVGAVIDRSTRTSAIVSSLAILGVSIVLSPAAWADWIAVLPSIIGLSEAPFTSNLAPIHVLSSTGFPALATIARFALPLWFGLLLVVCAWRGQLLAWVAAGTGLYLSATGTAWDHYFAALTPLAIAAWPRATPQVRSAIVAVLVAFGPLSFLSEQVLYQLVALGIWLTFLTAAILQFGGGLSLPASLWPTRRTALKRLP